MERAFFHSFPRPRKGEERSQQIEKGLRIVESMIPNGLLLTPEAYEVPFVDANGETIDNILAVQCRACFTELSPHDLAEHSKKFGPYAIAYDIRTLRSLGAMPVCYLPPAIPGYPSSNVGMETLVGAAQASLLVDGLLGIRRHLDEKRLGMECKGVKVEFSCEESHVIAKFIDGLLYGIPSLKDLPANLVNLGHQIRLLCQCFLPTERQGAPALEYYRQREWRLTTVRYVDGPAMTRTTPAQVQELLHVDRRFFEQELRFHAPRVGLGTLETDTRAARSWFMDVVWRARLLLHPDDGPLPPAMVDALTKGGLRVCSEGQFLSESTGAATPVEVKGDHWLTTDSNMRHNRGCKRYFGRTHGRPCGQGEGEPCKKCGG